MGVASASSAAAAAAFQHRTLSCLPSSTKICRRGGIRMVPSMLSRHFLLQLSLRCRCRCRCRRYTALPGDKTDEGSHESQRPDYGYQRPDYGYQRPDYGYRRPGTNFGQRYPQPTRTGPPPPYQRSPDPPHILLDKMRSMVRDFSPGTLKLKICPKCKRSGMDGAGSLLMSLNMSGDMVQWKCQNKLCDFSGSVQFDRAPMRIVERIQESAFNGRSNWVELSNKFPEHDSATATMNTSVVANSSMGTQERALELQPLSEEVYKYFAMRGISAETLERNNVRQIVDGSEAIIAFTYQKNGKRIGCKYRTLSKKRFWQDTGSEKIPYGIDDVEDKNDIIIVEGEIDKLSMEEAGYKNCISVPDGAPAKVSEKRLPDPEKDTKYLYLWNCQDVFDKAKRIILATDADEPGQALSEEIARRMGRERCWRVTWPKASDVQCKDANEVLVKLGSEALKSAIEKAEFYPIRGLFKFSDYFSELDAHYNCLGVNEMGASTGWAGLDPFYKVIPGELTLVTGVPNSGKSEWIDALLCNLNQREGWKFALCSMENKVRDHGRKLLEKRIRKPFFDDGAKSSTPRMNVAELQVGKEWLNDTFFLIRCEDDSLPSVQWVLELAKAAVLRHGVRGLVIDPYNELDHQRHINMTETEYVSQILTKVKRFAQCHDCHVWFVAHPRQLQNWNGSPPSLYDISGSAHFINKCDNGIVVHRNRDEEAGPLDHVQIYVRKVRNKTAGTIGDAPLRYERETGIYHDIEAE